VSCKHAHQTINTSPCQQCLLKTVDHLLMSHNHLQCLCRCCCCCCWRAEVVEAACGIAPMLMGETVENVAGGIDCYSLRQPLGVGVCGESIAPGVVSGHRLQSTQCRGYLSRCLLLLAAAAPGG
jgi:hypothetical protein